MLTWPDGFRPQRGGRPIYVPRNTAGTIALSGFTQVIAADAGTWKFVYENIFINGWQDIQLWDTLALRIEGRLNPFLVKVCEGSRQPQIIGGPIPSYIDIPHSDDALFAAQSGGPTGAPGYAQPGAAATVFHNAARRATTIELKIEQGQALQSGQFFSIGDRLYQVRAVVTPMNPTNKRMTVNFLPPLREAATAGDLVVLDRPVCKVRLATDNAMERILDANRSGPLSVTMLEDPF